MDSTWSKHCLNVSMDCWLLIALEKLINYECADSNFEFLFVLSESRWELVCWWEVITEWQRTTLSNTCSDVSFFYARHELVLSFSDVFLCDLASGLWEELQQGYIRRKALNYRHLRLLWNAPSSKRLFLMLKIFCVKARLQNVRETWA